MYQIVYYHFLLLKIFNLLLQVAEEEAADVDSKFRSLVAIGSLVSFCKQLE